MSVTIFIERFVHAIAAAVVGEENTWETHSLLVAGTATPAESARFVAACLITSHSVCFFSWGLLYTLIHALVPIEKLAKWRFQGMRRADPKLIQEAVIYTACFHFVISILAAVYFAPWLVARGLVLTGGSNHGGLLATAPSLGMWFVRTLFFTLSVSFFFYWGHRLLHITQPINLYALIHKQHHRFVTTCSWAAEFAHPVELLIGNVLPVLSGPLILGALGAPAHPTELFIWLVLAISSTCMGHSGLWYPGATRGFHDMHHSHNAGEFGTLTEWDKICGTDAVWRREKAKQAELIAAGKQIGIIHPGMPLPPDA